MDLSLYIYVVLGFLIVSLELFRRLQRKPIDALTAFNCYYFILYVFVPINVIAFGAMVVRQQYAYNNFGHGDEYTALSLLLSYGLFCLGYAISSTNHERLVAGDSSRFCLRNSLRVVKVILLLGFLTMAIHVIQIGGVLEVIAKAREVRSGELVVESKFLFFRHFNQFLSDAFVLLVAVLIGKRVQGSRITAKDTVFLLCAFVLFVYYALSTAGRRPFIYPAIICYLVYSSVRAGGGLKMSLGLLALTFFIAGVGPLLISGSVGLDENVAKWSDLAETGYMIAVQGLGDSFIHFVAAQNAELWQFGFLTDILNLPLDFFPSQLFGFERGRHMLGETSEFILGHPLAAGASGEEPLGLHGYLLVNFGYPGMFILFGLLGSIYSWLHKAVRPSETNDAVGWLIYWWIFGGFFVYFRDGVAILLIKQQLTWWITIGLLLMVARKSARRSEQRY